MELVILNSANSSLSKTLNGFYKKITEEDENFVIDYFHSTDLSECMGKLNKMANKFSELKKISKKVVSERINMIL